jgi:hypothetical protein
MKAITLDHPNLRRSTTCPFCAKPKERGLVVCWQCYRIGNMRYGGECERVLLDLCEAVAIGGAKQ